MTPGLHFQTTDGPRFIAEMMETCTMSDHKSGAVPWRSPNPQGSLADPSPRAQTKIQNTQPAQINKLPSCLIFKEQRAALLAGANLLTF